MISINPHPTIRIEWQERREEKMSAAGNIDRSLTTAEIKAAGKAVAAFIRTVKDQRREVATYALSVIVTSMAAQCLDRNAAEREIIDAVASLCNTPTP